MADLIFADVSHWQSKSMNWSAAVGAGLTGAVIKYTQGSAGVDPLAFLHAWNAYQARVPLLGAYHFGDSSDGAAQAYHFLDLVRKDYGDRLDGVMLMLDAERNTASQMTVAGAEKFVQTIKAEVGRWPWVYTGRYGPTGDGSGLPNDTLALCPLLVAAYDKHNADLANYLPPGWSMPQDSNTRAGVCRGWQFTDGTINGGPFPGLGRVDQSKFIGITSLDEARAIWT